MILPNDYNDIIYHIKNKSSQHNLDIIYKISSDYDIKTNAVYKITIMYRTDNYMMKSNDGVYSRREIATQTFENCDKIDVINWFNSLLEDKLYGN